MAQDWRKLPILGADNKLLFQDTISLPIPGRIVPCLMCQKVFIMRPYSGTPDQVCPECWMTYRDCARVICSRCVPAATICRLMPKVLDNGYYIQPRSVLHSSACNVCQPGLTMSTIIEIDNWMKQIRPGKIIVPFGKYK